jgi:predicted PurR-regulated permease PerM
VLPEVLEAPGRERLRVSGRSIVLAVVVVVATVTALRILASAERVLGWVLIASSTAALIAPAVAWLSRRLPRGLAVAAVAIGALALAGLVTYGLVDDVVRQTHNLERSAPELARRIETDSRFGDAATEADLSTRVEHFVKTVPERLRGGTPADAIRSAATRGLAFLAVFVLTMFFLLHGARLAQAAVRQIHDDERRALAERVGLAVYRRAFGYARGTILLAAMAGAFAYGVARTAGVPGPVPLALWVALWDAVPLLGAVLGAFPIAVLAGVDDPARGVLLMALFVGYQAFEYVVLQRRIEHRTVKVGPFLTAAGGFAGLELYGLTGALLAVLALAIGAVVLDESTAP